MFRILVLLLLAANLAVSVIMCRVTEIYVGFRHDSKNERSAKNLEISRLGGF